MTPDYIELEKTLSAHFKRWLEPESVKWPGPQQLPALLALFEKMPNGVSQDEITSRYQDWGMPFEYNKQARHLSSMGWDIATGNTRATRYRIDKTLKHDELALLSVTTPNPVWLTRSRLSRQGAMGAADWKDVLLLFSSRGCAVCGERVDNYDKGHLDPTRPPLIGNIVPMCASCNNWGARWDVTFEIDWDDLKARPRMQKPQKCEKIEPSY
jgi:hypothetical protein